VKTILLADDSITIQKVVELTFSEVDYRVICVSSGGQALKKAAEVRPDIVLLDVIMPEKNGYEVCEQLKRNPSTRGIPVLLLTGTFEPFDKKRADAAGANGHVTKPFESQVLVGKVEELIAATPTVSSDDEEGRMDIISGGDIYHVDPGRAAEGMRPAVPPVGAALQPDPAPAMRAAFAAPPQGGPAVPSLTHVPNRDLGAEEREESSRPHPAMATPDPAAGGSYVGFADIGLDAGMEGEVVPDRFDDAADVSSSPTTMRLRREDLEPPRASRGSGAGAGTGPVVGATGTEEVFEGAFEQEFDLADEVPSAAPAAAADEGPDWTPPPEAPPAETWQAIDEPSASEPAAAAGSRPANPPPAGAGDAPAGDGRGVALTTEMIDLIAEKVVERLSDRVVREIAWEVVPGVAETLVRRRIKELEESGSG
jgi:CheY-like chemotaxis protein